MGSSDLELLQPLVDKITGRMLRGWSPEDVEDIRQTVWLRLLSKEDRYDPTRASLEGWACVVIRSAVLDEAKRLGRHGPTVDADACAPQESREADPSDLAVARELAAGASVPDNRRKLFDGLLAGYSQRDIAAATNTPLRTITRHVAQLRQQLLSEVALAN